jgi:hypothetical protein
MPAQNEIASADFIELREALEAYEAATTGAKERRALEVFHLYTTPEDIRKLLDAYDAARGVAIPLKDEK